MKGKKAFLVLLTGLFLALLFVGNVQAKKNWYICTVGQVGPSGNDDVRVRLTDIDGAFTSKWFRCREGREKEMLAVLLCAASSNMNVKVYTQGSLC